MSRRADEKRKSLGDLARLADESKAQPWIERSPPKPMAPPVRPAPAAPRPSAFRPAAPRQDPDAERARKRKLEERRAKLAEERALRERRARELQRGATLEWRGMDRGNVPAGIRRTAFDRTEPTVSQKIADVLGDAKEKAGRAKNRSKGRRQGGGR